MERYESLGVVGEGSYGLVLRCRHKESGQTVAVKKFLESEDDPTVKKIALREVRMLKKLRHENLVNLIEFFRRKRRLYLVFEYVDHTILDELEASDGGLDEETARAHIFQVLRGIAFCHQNQIIHRDIKPENVLVSRQGVVKLCDFGFARLLAGPGESCTDYVATRWYRAPELLVGDTKYGREVDVWASGCLLSEMLTGEPLFPGESDIDQLFHIIQTLGELSISHRHLVERNPMLAGLRLPEAASTPLSSSFPSWSPRAHAFVSVCLCLEPSARPSAQDLLNHDFFMHDCFPETFLPILKQRVQQEFSNNFLLSLPGRRVPSTADRKGRARKIPGGTSPESVYGRSIARPQPHPPPPARSDNPVRSSPMKQCQPGTPDGQSGLASRPVVSFAPLTPSHVRGGPSGVATSTFNNNNNYSNMNNNNIFNSGEDAPHPATTTTTSTASSRLIPPLRDHNTVTFSPTTTTAPSTMNTYNNNNNSNHNNNTIALTLHITGTTNTSSPSRTRPVEKSRKSPASLWGVPLKPRGHGLCIQGQGQAHWDDDDHLISDGPSSFLSSGRYHTDHGRSSDAPRPIDASRHPYTISLDRTKELVARDSSSLRDAAARDGFGREFTRDPLREIKDNPRERERRPRLEITGWARPRLLNNDLSLPNVPGVPSPLVNSGQVSPKKYTIEGGVGKRSRRGGLTMPALSSVQRGSPNSLSRSVGGATRREAQEGEEWRSGDIVREEWRSGEVVREEWLPGGDDEEGE
ncbi:cyclin-dependent kinase C-1-like isoform X1 [Portunus trituberculatus]|uniref:cyclin-dependent kinase C-1-like isoform X1 n=1 Tax=Portunus trituberculatus TaxID=210409 RepID=UPI001E1CD79D|nr:cyclin-dependent kinase C-1-like isoform X1 [Portunus trituberculatus]